MRQGAVIFPSALTVQTAKKNPQLPVNTSGKQIQQSSRSRGPAYQLRAETGEEKGQRSLFPQQCSQRHTASGQTIYVKSTGE